MILVIHSSPQENGNLERMAIKTAISCGHEYELIRLSDLTISSCTGCAKCAATKRCIQKDDMRFLYPKLEKADGLILGGANYNGRVNSIAHVFMERLFPLYHQEPVFRDMPAAIVATGSEEPEKAALDMAGYLRDIYFFDVVGMALFTSDTPPCFSCGKGTECPVGIPALKWSQNDFKAFNRVKKEMFQQFEDNPDIIMACTRLGKTLARSISGEWTRPRSGGGFYLPASG